MGKALLGWMFEEGGGEKLAEQAYLWRANAQTFFAKCLSAILDFLGRGRLGRETNFYQEGWLVGEGKEGGGGGKEKNSSSRVSQSTPSALTVNQTWRLSGRWHSRSQIRRLHCRLGGEYFSVFFFSVMKYKNY